MYYIYTCLIYMHLYVHSVHFYNLLKYSFFDKHALSISTIIGISSAAMDIFI